jgi:capsular polysaccharide biosynthesis protein
MELREYWAIIRRWWWVPALLVLGVGIISLATQRPWQPAAPAYTTSLSFSVGVQPQQPADGEENYYTALASEYLIDDLAEVVRGSEFAAAVSARLAGQGITVTPGALQGSTQAGKLHRILDVGITWGNPEELDAIADAVAATVEEQAAAFMPRLFAQNAAAYLVDRGGVAAVGPGLREQLDLPVRLLLALAMGIALAFLLDYLDDRIRGREDVEQMGLAVLAEVPKEGGRRPAAAPRREEQVARSSG